MTDEKAARLYVREFGIGVTHLISTGNYQNIKIEASIKFGVPVGCSDEEMRAYQLEAQTRLEELARETYAFQRKGHVRLTQHARKVQNRNETFDQSNEPNESNEE